MAELIAAAKGVAPPVVLVLLLAGGLGRRWLAAALALGVLAAYVLLKEWPEFPGRDGTQWWLWALTAAALVASGEAFRLLTPRATQAAGSALFVAMPWFVLERLRPQWSLLEAALQLGAAVAAGLLAWVVLRRAGTAREQPGLAIAWTAVLAVDAFVLLRGGTGLLAQLAGAAAAATGTTLALAIWRRPAPLDAAMVLPLLVAHVGLLLAGWHFSYAPNLPATLAAWAATLPLALAAGTRGGAVLAGAGLVAALAGALFAASSGASAW